MIRIRFDEAKFRLELEAAVAKLTSPAVLDDVARAAREIIVDRTRDEQVDQYGAGFAPLSTNPIYVSKRARLAPKGGIQTPQNRRKAANYRKRTGSQHTITSQTTRGGKTVFYPGGYREYRGGGKILDNSGDMLNTLQVANLGSRDGRRVLRFTRPETDARARGHCEGIPKRLPRRDFFGITRPQDQAKLKQAWEESIRRRNGGK